MKYTSVCSLAFAVALVSACAVDTTRRTDVDRIENIVVIYAENHSFDNMYGMFPDANGVANATQEQKTQLDHDGKPLPYLPPVYNAQGKPDTRYPSKLPNGPFRIDAPPVNGRFDQIVPSPTHRYWNNQEQINGGRNNLFVALGTVGSWPMGYYDGSSMKVWQWAREYTLADNFFMGAFGGSFLNHQWLICACAPLFANAPDAIRAQLDEHGKLKRRPSSPKSVLDGPVQVFRDDVTPDGYAVNSMQPPYQPSGVTPLAGGNRDLANPAQHPLPPQTAKTIGDTLSAKGVSWAWYAGGWNQALADGRREPTEKRSVIYNSTGAVNFMPHHQPFNYFARFAPGTTERLQHLKDGAEFLRAIDTGTLPQVALYKPVGQLNQNPGDTDIASGDVHISEVLERLRKSPQWSNMVVIVTYDENGGYWDHVPPPSGPGWSDRWGPGTRIPTIIVSPYAKRGFVDHTRYDTGSILKLINKRFALEPLAGLRPNAGDLTNAFNFAQ